MPTPTPKYRINDYPFGSSLNTRSFSAGSGFRFGFNGKENFDKYQDYGFRIYYRELGKFLSTDPIIVFQQKYPELSSFQFASNTPISAIDLDGLEAFFIHGTNSSPIRWDENKQTIPTLLKLTNNKTYNECFSWSNIPEFEHNGFFNNENDRTVVAHALAAYVLAFHIAGEEITLIGHSHGGNVAILAADLIYNKTGQKVNLITIATPVYEGKNESQDPANHNSINDHLHFWSKSDPVQGGLAGDEVYSNSITKVFEVSDNNGHSFDLKNPDAITQTKATKLTPISTSKSSPKFSKHGGSGMGMLEKAPLENEMYEY